MRNPSTNRVGSRGSDIDPNARLSASCANPIAINPNIRPTIIRTTTADQQVDVQTFTHPEVTRATQATHGVQGERLFRQLSNLNALKRNHRPEEAAQIDGMSASQQALELRKARDDIPQRRRDEKDEKQIKNGEEWSRKGKEMRAMADGKYSSLRRLRMR